MTDIDFKRLRDPFPADDIEWRIGQAGKSNGRIWAKVLAYITSRAIMDRLDEVCGPENWQSAFRAEGDSLAAGIGVYVNGQWVWKWDGAGHMSASGGLSEHDAGKGDYSNALKRAGYQWGIGRYLYNLEEGFAEIASERGPGFRYGRLPKDKGGDSYYWAPPQLPAWALPNGSPRSSERPAAPRAASPQPPAGGRPSGKVPNCPDCDGPMWDNREGKRNPKAPDFKCKDKSCDGAIWPDRKERTAADDAADLDRIVAAIQTMVNDIKGLDAGDGDAAQKVLDEYVAKPDMNATRLHRLQTNIASKLESMREEVPSYDEPVPFPDAGAPV